MAGNFKETILKLLSATNYSLDNLSEDQISSFNNLQNLKTLFEWLGQNLSEANCITPEELEEFKKLQLNDKVKYGEELEEAIQAHLNQNDGLSVPFKESLNDAEQELTLLQEQLHYNQALHQALCSSNAVAMDDIRELKKKQQRAKAEQTTVIKDICSANKALKDKITEVQANINEVHGDIIGLAHNGESLDVSSDEGIHSLTSEHINLNKSLSASTWSLTTSSSWQTITGKDSNIKYMCQLSFDKYQRMHKLFLKRLTKLLDNLSKVEKFQNNSLDCMDLLNIKKSLQKQIYILIEKEAKLEGIRSARGRVKEFHNSQNQEDLKSKLEEEYDNVEKRIDDESLNLISGEELATACQQWAEYKSLQAVELKLRERVESSKCLIEKMDEILNPLILKLNADKILLEVLRYEKEKVEMSINLYKSFYKSLQDQFDQIKKRIETMQTNFQDFNQFCSLPLEERNDLVEQLASIVCSDNRGIVQTVQQLCDSSRREHETMYKHYVQEKNKLILSGKQMEESCNAALSQNTSRSPPSELVASVQCGLDHLDCGIEEATNDVHELVTASQMK